MAEPISATNSNTLAEEESDEISLNREMLEQLAKPVAIDLNDYVPVPPDGGWGWVVVFASFSANLVVDGIGYAFGVLFSEFQQHFNSSKATTALVGSLLTGCYLLVGPVVSGLVNKFGSRPVMMCGALIGSVALFSSVFVDTIYGFMFCYGVLGGIGFGLIYLPAIVHVGYYFERQRALATGFAVAGSGVGTFLMAPLCVIFVNEYGWQGCIWMLSGLVLNCMVCGALLRPLKSRRKPEQLQKHLQTREHNLKNALSRLTGMDLDDDKFSFRSPSIVSRPMEEVRTPETPQRGRTPSLGRQDLHAFARILAMSENNEHMLSGESLPKLSILKEGKSMDATDEEPRPSRAPRQRTISSTYASTNLPDHPVRSISRVSARSYATSLQRLNSTASAISAAHSIFTLSGVDPADFGRPLYRQDIMYGGSIVKLNEFKSSKHDLSIYRQSTTSIPPAQVYEDIVDALVPEHMASMEHMQPSPICYDEWMPPAVREVLLQMIDVRLLRHPDMILLALSNVLAFLGFYVPFVFLSDRAMTLNVQRRRAALLLSVIGVTNTFGRVFFGWLADRGVVSALTITNVSLLVCGALTLSVPAFNSFAAMTGYSAIFGFFISAYISLTSIILVELLGLESLTNSFGLLLLSRGVSAVVGSPIAGAVYDLTNSFDACFYYAGALIMAAGLVSCIIPLKNRHLARKSHLEEPPTRLSVVREAAEEPLN